MSLFFIRINLISLETRLRSQLRSEMFEMLNQDLFSFRKFRYFQILWDIYKEVMRLSNWFVMMRPINSSMSW